ncbi:MAG: hypothetical protein HQK97_02600 [Nitrospirae bacterium]|nr:hypothetical protein [Nitrospirota bacterium]
MATVPTPEDAARYILKIFKEKYGCRTGQALKFNNFMNCFNLQPWKEADLAVGMEYAVQQNWVEILPNGVSFKLTNKGFLEA